MRASVKEIGDEFLRSCLYHYFPEHALGTWEIGGPTTHVRDVAGVEPEDILTIARHYTNGPSADGPWEFRAGNRRFSAERAHANA